MREFVALGAALAGSVFAIVAVVEVSPGGQIATGRILLVVLCFVVVALAHFWPARDRRMHSDAHKVRHR